MSVERHSRARSDPLRELVALDQLAGRVAGVAAEERLQAASHQLARAARRSRCGSRRARAVQDRDRDEALERAEQLLVGGVVGNEVPHVDLAQRCGQAGHGGAAAGRDAHVLDGVLRAPATAIDRVVEIGNALAQRLNAADGGVLVVAGRQQDLLAAGRRAGDGAALRARPGPGSTTARDAAPKPSSSARCMT